MLIVIVEFYDINMRFECYSTPNLSSFNRTMSNELLLSKMSLTQMRIQQHANRVHITWDVHLNLNIMHRQAMTVWSHNINLYHKLDSCDNFRETIYEAPKYIALAIVNTLPNRSCQDILSTLSSGVCEFAALTCLQWEVIKSKCFEIAIVCVQDLPSGYRLPWTPSWVGIIIASKNHYCNKIIKGK